MPRSSSVVALIAIAMIITTIGSEGEQTTGTEIMGRMKMRVKAERGGDGGPMEVAGADVWKGQWIVVILVNGGFHRAFVAKTIEAAIEQVPDAAAVGIDMPIGLPEPGNKRLADQMARDYVGPRWQSVFMTPSLDLLEAETHVQANQLAAADGREGISAQAYALRTQILQVQPLAKRDRRLYEVHPEVSFANANGGAPLRWSKSSWNGINLRRQILVSCGISLPDDLASVGGAGCADVLDAAITAWSADRIAAGKALRLPKGSARAGAIWS